MRLFMSFLFAVCCQLTVCQSLNATESSPRLEEVISGLDARERAIRSLKSIRIQFEWVRTDHTSFSEAQETEYIEFLKKKDLAGAADIPGSKVRTVPGGQFEIARKGNMLYCKSVNPLNGLFGEVGLTSSFDGQAGVSIRGTDHANISMEIPGDSWQFWQYPNLIHTNFEMDDRPLKATQRLSPLVRPVFLPEDMHAEKNQYSVIGTEVIDGHDCVHVRRDDDFDFWLSMDEGFALRLAKAYWPQTPRHPRLPRFTTKCRNFKEVSPGVWMPFSILQSTFSDPILDSKRYWGTVSIEQELLVREFSVDDLPDDFFRPRLPKGLRVNDFARKMEYVTRADGIPFGEAINYAQNSLDNRATTTSWRLYAIIVANLILIVCVVVWWRFSKG